jgi:hypothetical protein
VVKNDGKPADGVFVNPEGDPDPTTPENYERRRMELWQEDWSTVELPFEPADVAQAYLEVWGKKPNAA